VRTRRSRVDRTSATHDGREARGGGGRDESYLEEESHGWSVVHTTDDDDEDTDEDTDEDEDEKDENDAREG